MKNCIFILLLLSIALGSSAQTNNTQNYFSYGIQGGMGTYDMGGYKKVITDMKENIGFSPERTSDFPSYATWKISMMGHYNRYAIGSAIRFQSTGARLSSQDYSGEYLFDLALSGISYGIVNQYSLRQTPKSSFDLSLAVGVMNTKSVFDETLDVFDEVLIDATLEAEFSQYYVEPGLSYVFNLSNTFRCSFDCSYYLSLTDETIFSSKNDLEVIAPDWDGVRFGFTFYYNARPR